MPLPIESVLPLISRQLEKLDTLVIQAPPGAGKTTLVPLALLKTGLVNGRILLIQPRRLAVYGAANRMATLLDERIGETVGYTTRYDSKTSTATQVEVITEGIFLRKIQNDPELADIGLVIFDEFHERSVTNDLGLAFAIESQQGYRESDTPLKLIVMSATLDGDQLSNWLQAPLIKSEGRSFPVDTYYYPAPAQTSLDAHIAQLITKSLSQAPGSVLVFLPGMKEINRTYQQLSNLALADNVEIFKLHASLPQEKQQQAIAPCPDNLRKIVLTTNVAETSVTIEGIGIVIDCGLVRISRFEERRGMNVLVTEKISAASSEQRKGRAGRLSSGICFRAWSESEQHQLKPFSEPEINRTDLLPVALELAIWGVNAPEDLKLLTQPNTDALQRAQHTLLAMDAVTASFRITPNGSKLAQMGLHPRLAQLIIFSADQHYTSAAISIAAILSEGDPLRFHQQWPQTDISIRLSLWESTKSIGELHKGTWQRIKQLTTQLTGRIKRQWCIDELTNPDVAIALAHAFPDRVAQLRKHSSHRYLLANGKGVQLNPEDSLAATPFLIVLDASGNDKEPFIRLACAITEHQLNDALNNHYQTEEIIEWNKQKEAVEALKVTQLSAITLSAEALKSPAPEAITACLVKHIASKGLDLLPWNESANQLKARVAWLHQQDSDHWPDWNNESLVNNLADWLAPYLNGMHRTGDLQRLNMAEILKSYLSWEQQQQLDNAAPISWPLPTGAQRIIRYEQKENPTLTAKMQELYGLTQHPTLHNGTPLLIEICSPANRPIQLTKDLTTFWSGSYHEVAKEMRGRYPKHYWPENPATAAATNKTKKHM